MVFDEKLADRIRTVLARDKVAVEEKLMFGGICFMAHGHMSCGVLKDDLIVRVAPEEGEKALALPHVRPFDFTGRPMAGMLYVAPGATKTAAQLQKWIQLGLAFAATRPAKKKKKKH